MNNPSGNDDNRISQNEQSRSYSSEFLDRIERRRVEAQQRINDGRSPADAMFLGIVALSPETPEYDGTAKGANWIIRLQRIEDFPNLLELGRATGSDFHAAAIGLYCPAMTHELVIKTQDLQEKSEEDRDAQDVQHLDIAFGMEILRLLRVITGAGFLVPAASSVSWSTIPACDKDCQVYILEHYPHSLRKPKATQEVTREDLERIPETIVEFGQLVDSHPEFGLAVDACVEFAFQASDRMKAAHLWSGIEALVGSDREIRYRTALYTAFILGTTATERLEMFRSVKNHYDLRSDIVHGRNVEQHRINDHIIEVREILSRLILKFVEFGRVPKANELDEMILSGVSPFMLADSDV